MLTRRSEEGNETITFTLTDYASTYHWLTETLKLLRYERCTAACFGRSDMDFSMGQQ